MNKTIHLFLVLVIVSVLAPNFSPSRALFSDLAVQHHDDPSNAFDDFLQDILEPSSQEDFSQNNSGETATNNIFSSTEGHYSFSLPAGWERISRFENVEGAPDFAFAPRNRFVPNIELMEINRPTLSISKKQLVRVARLQQERFVEKMREVGTVSNVSFTEPVLNPSDKQVSYEIEMQIANILTSEKTPVKGRVVMIIGDESSVSFTFTSRKSEFMRWVGDFNHVLNTFSFDSGYAYTGSFKDEDIEWHDPAVLWKSFKEVAAGSLLTVIVFGLIVLPFVLIKRVFVKLKNKISESNTDEDN